MQRVDPGLAWRLCAFAAGMLLTGCVAVLDPPALVEPTAPAAQSSAALSTPVQEVARPGAGGSWAPAAAANPLAPGFLYFVVAGEADRYDDRGWRLQLLQAASQEGFIPLLSSSMRAGMHLKIQLWPDSYRARVLAERVHYDGWVQIDPGAVSVLQVDPSSGEVAVSRGSEAASLVAQLGQPVRELRLRQTYQPLRIPMPAGLEGRYYGPRLGGKPAGSGQLDLFRGRERVATVEEAAVDVRGHFTGQPVFVDGRKVDGLLAHDNGLQDDVATEYQDGRIFSGRYQGIEPHEGTMKYPDGKAWTGLFEAGEPVGEGRLKLTDGTVIEKAPGPGAEQLPPPTATPKAPQAPRVQANPQSSAPALAPTEQAAPPPMTQSASGCGSVNGRYATSTGLSKLTFDGRGRGHLWQHTYGGARSYTFDVDFRYSGSHDSMRFEYEEGIYRDAGQRELSRQRIPGGSASCSYDGKLLNIGGTKYFKQ